MWNLNDKKRTSKDWNARVLQVKFICILYWNWPNKIISCSEGSSLSSLTWQFLRWWSFLLLVSFKFESSILHFGPELSSISASTRLFSWDESKKILCNNERAYFRMTKDNFHSHITHTSIFLGFFNDRKKATLLLKPSHSYEPMKHPRFFQFQIHLSRMPLNHLHVSVLSSHPYSFSYFYSSLSSQYSQPNLLNIKCSFSLELPLLPMIRLLLHEHKLHCFLNKFPWNS